MPITVSITQVAPRHLAAVRRRIPISEISAALRPALDQVWAFLASRPELRADGHNVLLYHHGAGRNAPMDIDFGVEITAMFAAAGEVEPRTTPAGRVGMAVHTGPYARLYEPHTAIHEWCARNGEKIGSQSWEIYGDWSEDPAQLQTTVCYLLHDAST
jgi:effector-binding domain-containing protein